MWKGDDNGWREVEIGLTKCIVGAVELACKEFVMMGGGYSIASVFGNVNLLWREILLVVLAALWDSVESLGFGTVVLKGDERVWGV